MSFPKAILAAFLFFWGSGAVAQDSGAVLRGTVQGASGAPLSGATVAIANQATGQSHTTTSDPQGWFELRSLAAGAYEVRVSRSGFVPQTLSGVQLNGGQPAEVSFTLEASAVAQRPEGAGAAASRISEEQLSGLPLNGRSYNQLATLQAGISDPSAASGSRGLSSGGLSMVGGRSNANNYLLDGINVQDFRNSSPRSAAGVQLGSDAVLQVQVFAANYAAEYGRSSGGALNSITRSGSNEYHGTVFEYFRNSKLDARNFFDQAAPPPFKRNQFGATITGPIRKEKTFFALSLEAMRDRLSETRIDRYPDEYARQGLLPDPYSPGSFINVGLHPRVKLYLDRLYPLPNSTQLRGGVREHAAVQFFPTNDTFAALRVDHSFSERDGIFVRYSFDEADSYSSQSSSVYRTLTTSRQQVLTLAASHIFSLNAVNSFRFGYTRPWVLTDSVASIEIHRSLYFFPEAPKFGLLHVAGLNSIGPSFIHPETNIANTFQFGNDVILQKGQHTPKFGVQIHRYWWFQENFRDTGGTWTFNGLESFLRGGPSGTNVTVLLPSGDAKSRDYRQTLLGFYVQDTYNVRPGFQVNLGLRYEFTTLPHDTQGRTGYLADPWRDTEVTRGPMLARNPSLRAFAPRLSLTWSPDSRTVVSGGFGMYYDQWLRHSIQGRDADRPFYVQPIRTNFDASSYFPDAVAATAGFPGRARVLEYWNTTIPTVLRYNLGVQRTLAGGWRVQAAYVGARGNHLLRGYEANLYPIPIVRADGTLFFPDDCDDPVYQNPASGRTPSAFCRPGASQGINPAFSGIITTNSDGQSFYNALQISANKSLGGGLSMQASYTFSKSVDDASGTQEAVPQYPYQRTLTRGLSDFDIRHRLVLNYFYNLPFGQGRSWATNGILARLLGGWRLGGILSTRTGTPFTAGSSVRTPGYLFAAGQPNLIAGRSNNPTSGVSAGCAAVETGRELRAPELYFDPCVFQVPEPGTLGTVGRNTLTAPTIFSMDVSLQREFLLDSRRRLQFRGEFFNLPNHVNFGEPSASVFTGVYPGRFNPSAGRISSTNTTSRQVQFALRFSF